MWVYVTLNIVGSEGGEREKSGDREKRVTFQGISLNMGSANNDAGLPCISADAQLICSGKPSWKIRV